MFKEKKNYMSYDYIIVGQGLAGSCMAMQLIKLGKRILVVDKPHINSSTKVAAGIFNPITGKKMVKTWKCDELFPALQSFYQGQEQNLKSNFFNPINIYRPFFDLGQQNEWMGRSTSSKYRDYVESVSHMSEYPNELEDGFGGLLIKNAGYVDLPTFIEGVKKKLIEEDAYLESSFNEKKIQHQEDGVVYENIFAKKLIICNGEGMADSTLFGWLPHSLVKGEVLEIVPNKKPSVIYNRRVFILPKKNGKCRVGATYQLNDRTYTETERARKTLVGKLDALYKLPYAVIDQVAGIRPATRDRRPFIGLHPEYSNIGIFNGLGAKGVSLAPYFSDQFAQMLEAGARIDNEVNINRYKSLYYDNLDK